MKGLTQKQERKLCKKLERKAVDLHKKVCFKLYGDRCELCGSTYLATVHHFYFKSSVVWLKFEILNGVILCCKCHARLHFKDAKLVEELIIKKRGKKWYNKLRRLKDNKPRFFKVNILWYQREIKKLEKVELDFTSKKNYN